MLKNKNLVIVDKCELNNGKIIDNTSNITRNEIDETIIKSIQKKCF